MKCPKCGDDMLMRFATKGANRGKYFLGCVNYPTCNVTLNYLPKYPNLFSQKYMGWVVIQKLKELTGQNKIDLINDIQGQMLEILSHYIQCRVGACYSSIFRFLLYDYLNDTRVLDYFLKSDDIKNKPESVIISTSGAKIFYDLFYDFMLVKSNHIKKYLENEFPEYFNYFKDGRHPNQQYSFVDYDTNTIKIGE